MNLKSITGLLSRLAGLSVALFGLLNLLFVASAARTEYPPLYYIYPVVYLVAGVVLLLFGPRLISKVWS
jgi:hypothetical protein